MHAHVGAVQHQHEGNTEGNTDMNGQNVFKLKPLVRHLNSTSVSTTLDEEELPYRLIASDVDDSSHFFETSNIERESSTVPSY